MNKKSEAKITNEKPVKIPLPFKKALAGLLAIKPPKEKPKEQDNQKQEKPSD